MQHGIIWCPHCGTPHALGTEICPKTAKSLDRSTAKPAQHPLVGQVLGGKYIVTKLIGSGGMGSVFEAENRVLKRLVAIKLVDQLSASPEAVRRLEREASLISAIQHPNVCDLYDVGVLPDASPYLVLERLFGESLAAFLTRQPRIEPDLAYELFAQLLSGLQAAHGANVIHRDVKPANIYLVDRIGCAPLVKLLDFGFAKDMSGVRVRSMTAPTSMLGTLRYMSPEVLARDVADQRTDIFGVGLVMYEAFTGEIPYKDPLAKGDVPPGRIADAIRKSRPDLPPAVADVVARALARERSARFQSALEMQQALSVACGARVKPGSIPPSSGPYSV